MQIKSKPTVSKRYLAECARMEREARRRERAQMLDLTKLVERPKK